MFVFIYSSIQESTTAGGDKSVSPAYTDEDKVSHFNTDNEIVNTTQYYSYCVKKKCSPFVCQDQDEAEQEGDSTLQELYLQTERKNSRSSDASEVEEEDEDEGDGQGIPLSISK